MLKCILFDLDGTLVNSLGVTFDGFNHAFQKFGGFTLTPLEIMEHFGPGEREIFAKVLGRDHAENAEAAYFSYVRSRVHETPLFSGIDEILAECAKQGISVGIVTGRGRDSTHFILEHHGMRNHFRCVLTHDDLSSSKPSPEGILKALELLGHKPDETLYLGDMWMDVRAAKRAGVKAVSAGWDPAHDRSLVEKERPDAWHATPTDFLAFIRGR